jgi:drug/metabolite transporter (DMT)-like permease
MTGNPYAPPPSDAMDSASDPTPARKSFARRTSVVLAVLGFAVFWGAVAFAASRDEQSGDSAEVAAGFGVLLAMVTNLVGIGIVFAAPRGRRLLPGLLNGVSFGIMVAILLYGLLTG